MAPSITVSLSLSLFLYSRVAGPSSHRLFARAHASPLRVAFTPMPEPGGFVVFTPFRIAFHACHATPRHATPCLTHHAMSSARAVSILAPPPRPLPSAGRYIRVPARSARTSLPRRLRCTASPRARERDGECAPVCAAPESVLELVVVRPPPAIQRPHGRAPELSLAAD